MTQECSLLGKYAGRYAIIGDLLHCHHTIKEIFVPLDTSKFTEDELEEFITDLHNQTGWRESRDFYLNDVIL